MENKKWIILCIIGGILMIISAAVGSIAFFETLFSLIEAEVGEDVANIISLVIQILGYIAMGGGISIIIGAIIVALNHYRLGKFIISIGAGMGLIGLIISFITSIVQGSVVEDVEGMISEVTHGSYGFLGIVLTIIARIKLKQD